MKQILLLTDFSENAWSAMKYASDYFKNISTRFHVLHVKDMRGFVSDDLMGATLNEGVHGAILGESKKQLEQLTTKIKETFENPKHEFVTSCVYSPFFKAVTDYCDQEDIDQIVMGTTGATGAKQVFLGSVTSRIINKIDIPVLVIPSGYEYKPIDELLFPVDFKVDFLPITLIPLLNLLDTHNSKLKVLYVNEELTELSNDQLLNKEELLKIFNEYQLSYHTVSGLNLDATLSCLSEFLTVDMIIMIKKSKSFLGKVFNDTHIRKISYHTKVPLLVLPENQILKD